MEFIPIIPFLVVSIPESLLLFYMITTIAGKKVPLRIFAALAMVTALCSYGIRSLPLEFGFHIVLQFLLMAILVILFLELTIQKAVAAVLFAGIVLGLAEVIVLNYLLVWIFSTDLREILLDPLLRIVFALPHLLLLTGLTYIANKKQWHFPLKKSPIFILALVQAAMLIILMAIFHVYSLEVYHSFTIDILINVGSIVILISVAATMPVAWYLLKVVEREAKIQLELQYATEKNKLNDKILAGRHELYNNITAMYGYVKAGEYEQLKEYIEKKYHSVVHVRRILDIKSSELSSLISVKEGEAFEKGIEFNWRINIRSDTLPLTPDELIQVVGNLLDNAIYAAGEGENPKKIDMLFECSKLGLDLVVANTGSPIPTDIKDKIFISGYTTKDESKHDGLGLYLVNKVVQRLNGQMELEKPEEYQGVRFVIYIPYKR